MQFAVLPNAVVRWSLYLPRIRNVSCINIGPEAGYPDSGFSWFRLSFQATTASAATSGIG